jgi:hypothetical protein
MCKVTKSSVAVAALLVLSLAVARTTQANLISVELQDTTAGSHNFSGVEATAAAADTAFAAANVWNQVTVSGTYPGYFTSASGSGLVDSTGAATSVAFTASASGTTGWTTNNNTSGQDSLRGDNWSLYNSADSINWNLTGLEAGAAKRLFFYPGGLPNQELGYRLTIDTNGNGSLADESAIDIIGKGTMVTAITSGGGGILGQVAVLSGVSDACFAGFQVASAVPEPSMIILLGSSLIGLLAYAWKKRS